jgi:hypothetical protein
MDNDSRDALRLVGIVLGGVVGLGVFVVLLAPFLSYYVNHLSGWLGK